MDSTQRPAGTAKTYHPSGQSASEEQPITVPLAQAELEIMKAEGAKSVADKSPEIRSIALLLMVVFGVTLFSQIGSYVVAESFNTAHANFLAAFVSSNGILGSVFLLAQVIAIFVLLFTRKTSHAKAIILIAGLGFAATLVNGMLRFEIGPTIVPNTATLAVDFLILRKIFGAYRNL